MVKNSLIITYTKFYKNQQIRSMGKPLKKYQYSFECAKRSLIGVTSISGMLNGASIVARVSCTLHMRISLRLLTSANSCVFRSSFCDFSF